MERDNSNEFVFIFVPRRQMRPVAFSESVNVYCPEDGKFSFFNSPYPAHRLCAGIDIYPKSVFGGFAPSPVLGEVVETKRVSCPQGKGFASSRCDYVILLCSLENPKRWVKILHVEPTVGVGDIVEHGENLGRLLRSGFFDFWTDPHIHVEVRTPTDPIRARGGFKFERLTKVDGTEAVKDLSGTVVESKPEYSLIKLKGNFEHGIPVELDGQVGLLDAGMPHYGWIGVHVDTTPHLGETIRLCDRKIGTVESVHFNMCVVEGNCGGFTLKGKPVRLSLYLYASSTPLVKVIPPKLGMLTLKESEEVTVAIS